MSSQTTVSVREHGEGRFRLSGIAASHFLNDLMQALLIASYPLLRTELSLDFLQIGILSLTYQVTASVLQPIVGALTDRRAQRWSLAFGMALSGVGILMLGLAGSYTHLLVSSLFLGLGSAVFHPEAARLARKWAREKVGWGQSLFQLGGSLGTMAGPLLTAAIVLPYGQGSITWFLLLALIGVFLTVRITAAESEQTAHAARQPSGDPVGRQTSPAARSAGQLTLLFVLVCAKYIYIACFSSFLVFYLEATLGFPASKGLIVLFGFHAAVAGGCLVGGAFSDRLGTARVIAFSFWGAAPFALAFPYLGQVGAIAAAITAAAVIASAFPAIIVHAQSLVPARIGMISGLFYGTAFGVGGLASAVFGWLADATSVHTIFVWSAWLPLAGVLTVLLRNSKPTRSDVCGFPGRKSKRCPN
ncbi:MULTISPECIES: MFS transporter [unclassified Martelella]|uniref:MFS transporter n=1 Tax=unclassified Martelella TaxID=2629616 RepID=UPI0025C54108|nr:MFS transporter [Martelella sp.]